MERVWVGGARRRSRVAAAGASAGRLQARIPSPTRAALPPRAHPLLPPVRPSFAHVSLGRQGRQLRIRSRAFTMEEYHMIWPHDQPHFAALPAAPPLICALSSPSRCLPLSLVSLRVLHEGSDRLFVRCTVAAAERAGRATSADAIAPHSACSIVREAERTPLSPMLAIVNYRLAVALPLQLQIVALSLPMSFSLRNSPFADLHGCSTSL